MGAQPMWPHAGPAPDPLNRGERHVAQLSGELAAAPARGPIAGLALERVVAWPCRPACPWNRPWHPCHPWGPCRPFRPCLSSCPMPPCMAFMWSAISALRSSDVLACIIFWCISCIAFMRGSIEVIDADALASAAVGDGGTRCRRQGSRKRWRARQQHRIAGRDELAQEHRVGQNERECRRPSSAQRMRPIVPQPQCRATDEAVQQAL